MFSLYGLFFFWSVTVIVLFGDVSVCCCLLLGDCLLILPAVLFCLASAEGLLCFLYLCVSASGVLLLLCCLVMFVIIAAYCVLLA